MRVVGGVPGLLATGDEVDARYGDAVDGGPFACDGPPDGRGEVVIELRGCEGTGSFDEEDAGITVEADGVGVAQVGLIVAPTDLKFERVFHGSPYFFYQSFFFVFIRCVLGTSGSVLDTRGSVLGTMGGVLGSTAPEAVDALLISVLVHAAAGEQFGVELLETGRELRELVRSEDGRLSQDVEAVASLGAGVARLDGEEAGMFEGLQRAGLAASGFPLPSPAPGDEVSIAPAGDAGDGMNP